MRSAAPPTTQAPRIPQGPYTSQAVATTLVAAPPTQPARGEGQVGRGRLKGGGKDKCYALSGRTEAVASDAVIISIVPIYHRDASVTFYPGSTYSYVSSYFALYLVIIGSFETRVDLLLLSMVNFDVILGMDCLSPYHAILDCHTKIVMLAMPGLPWLEWIGNLDYVPSRVVPFLMEQQMVGKGCHAYLAFIRDVSVGIPTVESVPVVRDYPDVFPTDLPSMLPDRDIDFGIDL
ncbi:uncharacterized protein [Nicotiana tomentosiformis]|uniref:uncharacterized protein n=1 Tax=Nicotiana tomentosiformis TaxID=4098 RepID=UPI00388CB5B5